eukprot:scaffold1755_cov247-Pinguiococcus_pyrenoidosus.AAC.2
MRRGISRCSDYAAEFPLWLQALLDARQRHGDREDLRGAAGHPELWPGSLRGLRRWNDAGKTSPSAVAAESSQLTLSCTCRSTSRARRPKRASPPRLVSQELVARLENSRTRELKNSRTQELKNSRTRELENSRTQRKNDNNNIRSRSADPSRFRVDVVTSSRSLTSPSDYLHFHLLLRIKALTTHQQHAPTIFRDHTINLKLFERLLNIAYARIRAARGSTAHFKHSERRLPSRDLLQRMMSKTFVAALLLLAAPAALGRSWTPQDSTSSALKVDCWPAALASPDRREGQTLMEEANG